MPFDRNLPQYQAPKGIKHQLGKWVGAILLIFLLLFIMNYLVKENVAQLIERQIEQPQNNAKEEKPLADHSI